MGMVGRENEQEDKPRFEQDGRTRDGGENKGDTRNMAFASRQPDIKNQ